MKKAAVDYKHGLLDALSDPEEAAEYLNAALEEGSQEVFLMALRDIAEARGFSNIARKSKLNRENLYRLLSDKGNPQLSSLNSVLRSVGLRLAIEADHTTKQ
jgi:probable addiction module antidote protein